MLQVTDLRLGFVTGKALLAAVDGVSFAVSAGETFALLGESGCGKSVTAQGIMRLLPPAGHVGGGSVRLAGEELLTLPEAEMRRLRGARMELGREPVVWWSLAAAFSAMFILVLAANLFADAVRDAFDPRAA